MMTGIDDLFLLLQYMHGPPPFSLSVTHLEYSHITHNSSTVETTQSPQE